MPRGSVSGVTMKDRYAWRGRNRVDAAKNAAEEQVAEREQHGASDEVRCDAVFYASGLALGSSEVHLHRPE
jgi:hypothetical protein